MDLALKINSHLADNGIVQVTTHYHSMLYTQKHVGWFYTGKDGNLHVKSGRKSNQLSIGNMPMVGIRYGRYAEPPAPSLHCCALASCQCPVDSSYRTITDETGKTCHIPI